MSLAYLVNQYPHVSHTFIRREIAAHETSGLAVRRYSIRPAPVSLVDPSDIAEQGRTIVVLNLGWMALCMAAVLLALTHPLRFVRAAMIAYRTGSRANRRIRNLAYFVEACWLVRDTAQHGVTHIHAHFGTNPATVALLCRLLGGPTYSFTVHGPEEFDQPMPLALDLKIQHAAFVVAVSEFGRSQLCRWCHGSDWRRIHVIRCGVDAEFLAGEPTPIRDVPRFVSVGRLCEQKGQLILVQAMSQLHDERPDVQLILVGDGPMRQEIKDAINTLGLQDAIHITGWLNNQDVRAEIESSRAFVLPSFAEGLPVVIMEAFAVGRPVVSTFIAGIPELVSNGNNGWLVPAGSVSALADAMRDVLKRSPAELQSMGLAGRAAVAERHDAATEAKRLRQLFPV